MRVFVTGGTGFVASHLFDYLLRDHPHVEVSATRRWRSDMQNVQHLPEGYVAWHDVDLTDPAGMLQAVRAVKPDVVFHAAAQSYVPFSYTNPLATYQANILGTQNLLDAVRRAADHARVVLVTSSEVYGKVRPEDIPITEACPFRPASPYGVSKAAADLMGGMYADAYKLNVVRLRNFTTSGPRRGRVFFDSAWCRQVARIEAGKQDPVVRVGNLYSVRTVMDVRDLVRAYWILGTREEACPSGEAYNVAGDGTFSICYVLDRLRLLSSTTWSVRVDADLLRLADVTDQRPSIKKFREATGWEPDIRYEQTLREMLEFWRARV